MSIQKIPNPDKIEIIVLDNTVFVAHIDLTAISLSYPNVHFYTTSKIIEEAERNQYSPVLIHSLVSDRRLIVQDPSPKYLNKTRSLAEKSGDISVLSQADLSVVALTYELTSLFSKDAVLLFSDDYSVLNLASYIGLSALAIRREGIKKTILWEVYCPNCFHTFPPSMLGKECEICGGILKKRPRSKRKKKH